jgi:hypothetical protein
VQNDPVNYVDPSGLNMSSTTCSPVAKIFEDNEGEGPYFDLIWQCVTENGGDTGRRDPPDIAPGGGGTGTQSPTPTPKTPPCSSIANLAGAGTDEGALSRLIFQEATSRSSFGSDTAYRVELAAVASVVHNRVAFLNQPGLKQSGTLGFGNVGASIADVVYSRGNNPNGRSSIGTQFAGFTPSGISQLIQNSINGALNSAVGSADCNKLLDAIDTARNFRPGGADDFGFGSIFGVRTAGSGSPGGAFRPIGAPPGSNNVFFGLR